MLASVLVLSGRAWKACDSHDSFYTASMHGVVIETQSRSSCLAHDSTRNHTSRQSDVKGTPPRR